MAIKTVNATTPSTKVNFAVLRSCCDKILNAARRNQIQLGPDEYQLMHQLVYASDDGKTKVAAPSSITINY